MNDNLQQVVSQIQQISQLRGKTTKPSIINMLPAHSISIQEYKEKGWFSNEEKAVCYICYDRYDEGGVSTVRIKTLPCMHYFHEGCVDKWLKEYGCHCPICKTNLNELEY